MSDEYKQFKDKISMLKLNELQDLLIQASFELFETSSESKIKKIQQTIEIINAELADIVKRPLSTANLVNLTPHKIILNLYDYQSQQDTNAIAEIEPSGTVARVDNSQEEFITNVFASNDAELLAIPVVSLTRGIVIDLPAPRERTLFIVSSIVASHPSVQDRDDLVVPHNFVRNENGQIKSASALARLSQESMAGSTGASY